MDWRPISIDIDRFSAQAPKHTTHAYFFTSFCRGLISNAAYINQIYNLSAHVWKSLEDDLDVYVYLPN